MAIRSFTHAVVAGAGITLLNSNCWIIPTTLPVNQYNTRPLEAVQNRKPIMSGMNIIIFCWFGSTPAEGVIFCIRNPLAIMSKGRMRMARCSGWDKSPTQSQLALRIAIETAKTL